LCSVYEEIHAGYRNIKKGGATPSDVGNAGHGLGQDK
jgi:hypothetical protein